MTGDDMAKPVPAPAATLAAPVREVEVKFRADPAAVERVLAALQSQGASIGAGRELTSTYFDTVRHELRQSGFTLRVRRKGRSAPVLGVKWEEATAGDLFARGEVEVRTPQGEPDIALFEPALRARLTAVLGDQPVAAVFKTHVRRRIATLRLGQSEIEVALDGGSITAEGRSMPLSEVELELKSGTATDLIGCARRLALDCSLSLDFESKAARGYRLAGAALAQPQKAKAIELPATASFDDLLAAVLSASLSHFTANWASLRDTDAPESIHQLRVALRRMRSALAMFRKRIAMPELDDIRSRAQRIAAALGPARESDVFRQNALAGPFRDQPKRLAAAAMLLEAVENRRIESYAAARAIIDAPATSLFVLDVEAFLATRAWRGALAPRDLGLLTAAARDFASDVLDRLRRRAVKRGRHLPQIPDEQRHELRIVLKKLRYASEFFGGLFDDRKAVRKYLRLVAGLQDDLGAHNDAVTAEAYIATLALPAEAGAGFAAGYVLGYYRHATFTADAHLAAKWKKFRRATTFWD